MSFTCFRDEFDWPSPQSPSPFTSLWNMTSGETSWPPHIAGPLATHLPAPRSPVWQCCFCSTRGRPECSPGLYFFSLMSSNSGTLTKINLSSILKGLYIYKLSERILTWDLGDGEWSWLRRRHAEGFLASWRTFLDSNFLIEEITELDTVHRSKLCQSLQYLGTPKEKYYTLYIHVKCLNNRLKIMYN